ALGLGGVRLGAGRADFDDTGNVFHAPHAVMECIADARVKHGRGWRGGDGAPERLGEVLEVGSAEPEDESGLRAELPDAEGDRTLQPRDDLRRAFLERAGQDEERIETAHFREDGNRLWPRLRRVKERQARGARTGETDRARERMFYERHP